MRRAFVSSILGDGRDVAHATVLANNVLFVGAISLLNVGVDRYKRSPPLSLEKEKSRQREREAYLQAQVNDLWRTLPRHEAAVAEADPATGAVAPAPNSMAVPARSGPTSPRSTWAPAGTPVITAMASV